MKYAIVAAAIAGMAMAIPTEDWSNVKKCDPVTKTITTQECGEHPDAWDNCHQATKTWVDYPTDCPKKPSGCKGGKYPDGKECHDDDDDWSNWPKGCKWGKDKDGKDCKADDDKKDDKKDDWKPAPVKEEPKKDDWKPAPVEEKKCYSTASKVYTTKVCGDKKDAWDNCKDEVKTDYETKTVSCEWAAVTPTATWTAWVDSCAPVYKTYTTKVCGDKKDAWDNCKDETKTKTEYPATCTTSSKAAETWAPITTPAPVKPATTEVWNTWKASSTVAAPVAKWTGAADKQTVGFGALAIAAIAALL